jgi:DNA modification methylase
MEFVGVDAVVTDPPWGVNQDNNNTRLTTCSTATNIQYASIKGDEDPFDPTPWLKYPRVCFFGANCFSDKLPKGSWLIWVKKRESLWGKFLADAEVAWYNRGWGTYLFAHEWHGYLKASERSVSRIHQHQKPVAVMEWVMTRMGLEPGQTVLDPYMGSGSTGIAALNLGLNFIGVEKKQEIFDLTHKRFIERSL